MSCKNIVPDGVAQIIYVGGEKRVLGPGEYEFEYRYCSSTMLTRPHKRVETVVLKRIKNIDNSTNYTQVFCIVSFTCEIVNPTKYINCEAPVPQLGSDETKNSIDGEDYIDDMCTHVAYDKLCSLTLEDMYALKGTETDLTWEVYFPEYQRQILDNAGTKITQLKVFVADFAKGEAL